MTSVLSRVEKDFRGRSIRVLVVDDAPAMREVLSAFVQASAELELVGCAHDGQEGVELEARLHPDLVLMDVQMPVLNGLDATRLIKQQPEAPLVVILSMDDRAANRAAARAVGADAFVGKEHLHTELRPLLRRLCGPPEGESWIAPEPPPGEEDEAPAGGESGPRGAIEPLDQPGYVRASNRLLASPCEAGSTAKGRR